MGVGATPWPRRGRGDDSGARRVELDVAHGGEQMRRVEGTGGETPLPEIAGPALALVDRSGVAPVRLTEGKPQAGGIGGREQEVDVVRHQAPGPDGHVVAPAPSGEEFVGQRVVGGAEEGRLTAVAPLGHLMRDSGRYRPCQPFHGGRLAGGRGMVIFVWCPRNRPRATRYSLK